MKKVVLSYKIDTAFVLLVFCGFALSVLMVLMLGGNVYQNINNLYNNGYDERTCLTYIWSKVKNGDAAENIYAENIYIEELQDFSVLCIDEKHDNVIYQTKVYFYDGWVYELLCEEGFDFHPAEGTPVIKTQSLDFKQLDNDLIKVISGSVSLLISPRSNMRVLKGALAIE